MNEFLRGTGGLLALLAVLALFETLLPFSTKEFRRRHLAANLVLTGLTLCLNFAFNAGAVLVTAWLAVRGFGLLASMHVPRLWSIVLGVLSLDASTYLAHRLMHAIPALWRAHSVHHSDPLVDVTTALRFHPIETMWRVLFVLGPAWLLGIPVEGIAAYRVLSVFMAAFEHMNVRLWQPLDTALSSVIGTSNMHKVHHSRTETETNTNYGNILSLFDRLFGTFTPSVRANATNCGLDGHDEAALRLDRLLGIPLVRAPRSLQTADESAAHAHSRW